MFATVDPQLIPWIIVVSVLGFITLMSIAYFTNLYFYPFFEYKSVLRKIKKQISEIDRDLNEKELELLSDVERELRNHIWDTNPVKNEYGVFHKAKKILVKVDYLEKYLSK